jgi:hypothetical protein
MKKGKGLEFPRRAGIREADSDEADSDEGGSPYLNCHNKDKPTNSLNKYLPIF